MNMQEDLVKLQRKILGLKQQARDMSHVYGIGKYGKTHLREITVLADLMTIQAEYIENDIAKGGHDVKMEPGIRTERQHIISLCHCDVCNAQRSYLDRPVEQEKPQVEDSTYLTFNSDDDFSPDPKGSA